MIKVWLAVQSVIHFVAFGRMLARHAAREYLLLEQLRQTRSQVYDCIAKLTLHDQQHQQMLALLAPLATPATPAPPPEETVTENDEWFRDHPTPPGKA